MKQIYFGALIALVLSSCIESSERQTDVVDEIFAALGDQSVANAGTEAYSQPLPGLSALELTEHNAGDVLFEAPFVSAPAQNNGGLGPYFNAVSCAVCHPSDGKAAGPMSGKNEGFFLRPGTGQLNADGTAQGLEEFGSQLLDQALFGYTPMGKPEVTYKDSIVKYEDGEIVALRVPSYRIIANYSPLPAQYVVSPRVAPSVFGGGGLEAIREDLILAGADPDDQNKDGISGRVQWTYDKIKGQKAIGRFALKGENPNLIQQIAGAFHGDMGLTTSLTPLENVHGTKLDTFQTTKPEVSDDQLNKVVFYVQTLSVPKRRTSPNGGYAMFKQMDCAKCHSPEMQTSADYKITALRSQKIAPFTDLLLHDMGAALGDKRPSLEASGTEWKTPALWGIGLLHQVNGHTQLLHDGRARSIEEAILWHSGEAENSKEKFRKASKSERELLLSFVKSL